MSAERLLRLLALLPARRSWSGAELADRLGVTERTLRRDVERLRALDYPVASTTGPTGGYRLTSGRTLPPLQLADDEALAVAIALATAAAGGAGTEDAALRALAKLQQVLPARLRPRLTALTGTTAVVPRAAPAVDPEVLAVLAACCRDAELVAFAYRDRAGRTTPRRVEPHHLVAHGGRWYLVAFDPERADWRTFRADRIADARSTRRPFVPRTLLAPDPATHVVRSFAAATYRHTARLAVAAPAEAVRAGVYATIPGDVAERGPDACTVRLTAESAELVVQFVAAVAALGAPVVLEEASEEVRRRVGALGSVLSEWGAAALRRAGEPWSRDADEDGAHGAEGADGRGTR